MGRKVVRLSKIDTYNAFDNLVWIPEYSVVVCRVHGYAVRNIEDHLRLFHEGSKDNRREVAALFGDRHIKEPKDVLLPPPLEAAFECLGTPLRAYICEEPECDRISISRDEIRKHCNKDHGWRSSKSEREHWHQTWVQTFFNSSGLQRYFTVDHSGGEGSDNEIEAQETTAQSGERTAEIVGIFQDWDTKREAQARDMELLDETISKTDNSAWFKRTQWAEHLKGRNLRHLSYASRLPGKEEDMLRAAAEVNIALIERCVNGLRTLDLEVRRWLRSAKRNEPDQRPMARLQNDDSQQRYVGYITRLLCYTLRVIESEEAYESSAETDDDSEGKSTGPRDSDQSNSSHGRGETFTATDTMRDARALFPWRERQRELAIAFRNSLRSGDSEGAQQEALLQFYRSLIFQRLRADPHTSVLMHFLAVLGIDEELRRLREANDYSYMLAGVVYCVRVLGVEIVLPSAERDQQGEADDDRFREVRDEYLADGSFSPMSKMLSLLAYSKSLGMNHVNAGSTFWAEDRLALSYKGNPIELRRFCSFVQGVVQEAEDKLWGIMLSKKSERFEVALDSLRDNVTFTKRGHSFIDHPENGLQTHRKWLLRRVLDRPSQMRLWSKGDWVVKNVRRYLREIDRFRELLLLSVHLCGGQPARGTEITSIRLRNASLGDRNVYIIHGQVVIVTRYHKSQSQLDKPKVIPRFLPWRVGQLMVIYLAYVQPTLKYLTLAVLGDGASDYVWSNEKGPWKTERLTRIVIRESQQRMGVRLTTLDYRHVAIAVGREVIGAEFARGYQEGMDEGVEDQQEEDEDALEMSAGRGGDIGANRYGVPLDVIRHLSNKTVDTFRPLSTKWHEFVGLKSGSGKRSRRSDSISTEEASKRKRPALFSGLFSGLFPGWSANPDDRSDIGWSDRLNYSSSASGGNVSGSGLGSRGSASMSLALRPSPSKTSTPYMPAFSSPSTWHTGTRRPVERVLFESRKQTTAQEAEIRRAMSKVLGSDEVDYRSDQQREALRQIVYGTDRTPLVVVLPTGGGKSLLFMVPACLSDPGTTVVIVPYRALINNLVATAKKAGIDSMEWRPGEVNPAALVFVSADVVSSGMFISYAQMLSQKRLLRRIFVDESHLVFTSSNWRPKLAHVREVRRLGCVVVMLTATLPVLLEADLEEAMEVRLSRYIRAPTTRVRTRYIVHTVPAGKTVAEAVALCQRMRKHIGRKKGVVYSRSREQCEDLARELRCNYYHAASADNEEQLESWLERGGLIVATSALGTGVDFPGIVFVVHVELPYGMIDFAQESGRGGRAGKDVDSVIVVAEGSAERVASNSRGFDEGVMSEFITTKDCRRLVMSRYFDGTEVRCEGLLARCDRCGEGVTAMERAYVQDAAGKARFERSMDWLVDGRECLGCFVGGKGRVGRHTDAEETICDADRLHVDKSAVDELRKSTRFVDKSTHSCFKCGISQELCRTGQDSTFACQWPNVLSGIVYRIGEVERGLQLLRELGYDGEWGDWKNYGRWLASRQRGRVWNEVMSNAMVVLIRYLYRS